MYSHANATADHAGTDTNGIRTKNNMPPHQPQSIKIPRNAEDITLFCLAWCFMSQSTVSYGHVETISSPNHTFFLGKLT